MTKVDQAVESAADKLARFVRDAQASGGVKAKVGAAFAGDPEFVRKLKPSLVKARISGEGPPTTSPAAPSGPQLERPPVAPGRRTGSSPWVVIGAAFAVGYVLAKLVDWRGHAHPRV